MVAAVPIDVGSNFQTLGKTYQVWALYEAGNKLASRVEVPGPLVAAEEQVALVARGFSLMKSFRYHGTSAAGTGKDKHGKPKHDCSPNTSAQISAHLYANKLLGRREPASDSGLLAPVLKLLRLGRK